MSAKLPTVVIKRMAAAHSLIGLALIAPLYVVCLSGTISVFYEELRRWEQPLVTETTQYSATQMARAVTEFKGVVDEQPETLFVVLPNRHFPRMYLSDGTTERYVDVDGALTDPVVDGWTDMLLRLHNQLLLPETAGLILTGSLGAMLCGLIISGVLSHPGLFKDLFKLRMNRHVRLRHVDIHNRLGVWTMPFSLMFGLTGAFLGLVGVLIAAGAALWFANDRGAVIDSIYGADIVVESDSPKIDFARAFQELETVAPEAKPIYLMVNNLGTDRQYVEIAATLPQRLVWSEIYRFQSSGEFIDYQGLSDGPVGRQVAYSMYRLHFGHFSGLGAKLLYGVVGFAMSVVCVSGVNIWLARRKTRSLANEVWPGFVWGVPTALALSATATLAGVPPTPVFLTSLAVMCVSPVFIRSEWRLRVSVVSMFTVALATVIVLHTVLFTSFSVSPAGLSVNFGLLAILVTTFFFTLCPLLRQTPRIRGLAR